MFGSLTYTIQYNISVIELILKLLSHSYWKGKIPFALIAAHSQFKPKVLTYKKKETENTKLRFSLETMKGTTGQKRRTKQTKNKTQALGGRVWIAPATPFLSDGLSSFWFLILFDLNGVPRFGTINEERMKQFQFGI